MSGFVHQVVTQVVTHVVEDVGLSRRSFLQASSACVAVSCALPVTAAEPLVVRQQEIQRQVPAPEHRQWGMALAYGNDRLDLIDLDNARLLHSFEGLRATHAITPIEQLNRFVVHGTVPNRVKAPLSL